jgi:hypothetical protein
VLLAANSGSNLRVAQHSAPCAFPMNEGQASGPADGSWFTKADRMRCAFFSR